MSDEFPTLVAVCLDAVDALALAAFWKDYLGLVYHPNQGPEDGSTFIVIDDRDGQPKLAIQRVESLPRATWPSADIPSQLHLDLSVPDRVALAFQVDRAVGLGAVVLDDRREDDEDPLVVLADPAGHPFCVIAPPGG